MDLIGFKGLEVRKGTLFGPVRGVIFFTPIFPLFLSVLGRIELSSRGWRRSVS